MASTKVELLLNKETKPNLQKYVAFNEQPLTFGYVSLQKYAAWNEQPLTFGYDSFKNMLHVMNNP